MSNPKPRKRARSQVDWPAVEADYRAGLAVLAIARRHEVSPSAIYTRARQHQWTSEPCREPPDDEAGAPLSTENELAHLRVLAAKLRERLERVIDGRKPRGAVLGSRESPAALLLKLCQIIEKIIAIERRIAGAEATTPAQLNEQDRDILDRFKRRYGVG